MKKQAFNPYLPSWEYVPDGEPHVFGDRVYVYGSHDTFGDWVCCSRDYVCWSAPTDDLSDWRCEGVIYRADQDPMAPSGDHCLYAPDVTLGCDGRYYLYYNMDALDVVAVAVCETPAGKYDFYGYVHYADGTRLGEKNGDEPQYDPGVFTEGDKVYLYTGFTPFAASDRHGAMVTLLETDMLTIAEPPKFIVPGGYYSKGTDFEPHAFFEASSMRKVGDIYYFIYSSYKCCELCYAMSNSPTEGFKFGGVIIANNDVGVDTYKPADKPMYYGGNNHGSIEHINGKWYIFYHRQTNGTGYCRQAMAEEIEILPDGSISRVEMTSCGLNGGPLNGKGYYPTYIACNLISGKSDTAYTDVGGMWLDNTHPIITQHLADGERSDGFILNMTTGSMAGFKYFDCRGIKRVTVKVRGYNGKLKGKMKIKTAWDGEVLGEVPIGYCAFWTEFSADIEIPDGVHPLYFEFEGPYRIAFGGFTLE